MKQYYLFIFIIFFMGCKEEQKEQEYQVINIEKSYPYSTENHSTTNIAPHILDLFKQKVYLINSLTQLNNNPLFNYCPETLKEELIKCDFNQYSLIIASSSTLNEVVDLKGTMLFNNYNLDYEYNQAFYSKPLVEPISNIYFVLNAFSVKKIPDTSKISFSKSMLIVNK